MFLHEVIELQRVGGGQADAAVRGGAAKRLDVSGSMDRKTAEEKRESIPPKEAAVLFTTVQ